MEPNQGVTEKEAVQYYVDENKNHSSHIDFTPHCSGCFKQNMEDNMKVILEATI